jgi:hypothetical protein
MKIESLTRPLIVTAVTLTVILLVAVLLITTRSVGLTVANVHSADNASLPFAVTQFLLPMSTSAYNGVVTPAQKVYAPWLLGRTSVLRVFNAGGVSAAVRATFSYTGTGAFIELDPGAVGEIQTTAIPTGTQFSAILTATQPIVAVINDFGPDSRYATSYTAIPQGVGQRDLALPDILFQALGGWNTDLIIQNVGSAPANVTLVYTKTNEPLTTTYWIDDSILELAPDATRVVEPGRAGLPEKFVGIATIKSDQPLVAVVRNRAFELGARYPRQAYAYRVPLPVSGNGGHRMLYFPLLFNGFEDWNVSEIQIMNTAPTAVVFTLAISNTSSVQEIPGWTARSYRQDESATESPFGAAVAGHVADAGPLQGLVWLNGQGGFFGDSFAAYSSPSVGAQTWYVPYADQSEVLATYVAVQNSGDALVNVSLTYHGLTGTLGTASGTIGASDVAIYTGGKGLPSEFVGGVVVQADRPVAVITLVAGRLRLENELHLPVVMRNN